MLPGKLIFEAELDLMSFAISEDDSDLPAEPYIAKAVFKGKLPDGSHLLLEYQTGTTEPGVRTSGEFTGTETISKEDGSQVMGVPQGVWKRDDQCFKLYSLVAHSDNTQTFRVVDVKLDKNLDTHLAQVRLETYSI